MREVWKKAVDVVKTSKKYNYEIEIYDYEHNGVTFRIKVYNLPYIYSSVSGYIIETVDKDEVAELVFESVIKHIRDSLRSEI